LTPAWRRPGAWGAIAALALSACSTLPAGPAANGAAERWITGRLAVRVAATSQAPARSEAAAFELLGQADQGELRLLSPLGTVVVSARWGAQGAIVQTPEGQRSYASLEELSRELLGEALPLQAWPDWLLGRPWPGAAAQPQAGGFAQLGWRVNTAQLSQGLLLADRDSPPAVQVRVRLAD
jgi:outer membrane lipoprotein LolB